ncbi:PilC/PilY family type IV pilus protein [Variovorax sp. J22R133]|uniref:pilus assembly protein n=1 Tax=Variovorax brevis TaxID=3053503 RepID=UPI002575C1B5|nr:PilC/PilY family type IV pilus protein [Variovorax sp. J22R133]MDM0115281.1 PilC/PilY family type IV pilus protein [Variovorax sp. J22R133]
MKSLVLKVALALGVAVSILLAFKSPVAAPTIPLIPALQAVPPNVSPDPNLPMVMLNVSKDFSMFSRAYTDYEDLNFDGAVDYTFMPDFKYYGYFDSTKCYTYSTADNGLYVPAAPATLEGGKYYCAAGNSYWSGNFLNWATMSRMDVLRKILFGGLRSTDTAGTDGKTVLELSFVPRNSQAFVKYYNGADLSRLTPFSYDDGITLCRRHQNPSGDSASQSTTLLPVIRTAPGNYLLWNMTEVRTCNWTQEIGYNWKTPTVNFVSANYQGVGGTLTTHKGGTPPSPSVDANSHEYTARLEACNASMLGDENCKQYSAGNPYKPRGLLNEFGESDNFGNKAAKAEFAMLLGSFDSNLDGAVLRKNMEEINSEVDQATGQFLAASANGSIIQALSRLRLYGYNPNNGNYSQNCNSRDISNGTCPSWGNPISEMVAEGLRYYAGKGAYFSSNGAKDAEFALPTPAWSDPLTASRTYANSTKTRAALYGKNVCRPLNMVTISSGVSSFDNDKVINAFSALSSTAASLTTSIGTQEGITSTTRLIGNNGDITTPDNNDLCTGKTITDLATLTGLCPEAPNMKGSYLGAGAAYWAHTNQIRTDLTIPGKADPEVLKVRQYAVSMAGGSASIQIPVPGTSPTKYVYITPASIDSLISTTNPLAGNMVDFKVLNRAADGSSGSFLVLWQHYMLGEDQDQDMLGSIRYEFDRSTSPPKLKIYTQTLESDTGSQVPFLFGYTLVGTSSDGFHSHSAINNGYARDNDAVYDATTQVATGSGSGNCNDPRKCVRFTKNGSDVYVFGETLKTYDMTGSLDAVIRDPLWYIAKYGGFKDSTTAPTQKPDAITKWDTKRADGALCGASGQPACSDGIPDNYFLARRPDLLEESLRLVFADLTANSNSAPAVSRPDLRDGDFKYIATFSPQDLHGELTAYKLDDKGNFELSASAKGHENLTSTLPSSRRVITNTSNKLGVAFNSTAIRTDTTAGQGYLDSLESSSTRQDALIDYMRGSRVNEGTLLNFRVRNATSIMGGVINSNPWLQDRPGANFFGSKFPSYGTFKAGQSKRDRMIWVGASDGMLHGFTSDTLTPIMSYVPQPLVPRLKETANAGITDVNAYMDGSPFSGDVMVGTGTTADAWRTYLFGTLGRGGKGIFALNVTAPTDSTSNALTEANASSIFAWQFTSQDDADLGYIISEGGTHPITNQAAQIAKMPNGKFAVIFGNGLSSTNGKAVLYVLFVDGPDSGGGWGIGRGRYYKKIVVDSSGGNGLMQPSWIDTDEDGLADTIYAGDLKGNMWKFDVSDTDPDNWHEAYGKPLYSAKDATGTAALPIAAAPAIRFHPGGGQIVVFGTGKSVVSGDFPDTGRSQRIFGIWDKPAYASSPSTIPSGVSDLQQRSWTLSSDSKAIVQGSVTRINWTTQKGWYLDIPLSSGMVLSNLLYPSVTKDVGIPMVYKQATTTDVCNDNAEGAYVQISAVDGTATVNIFGTTSTSGIVVGIAKLDQRFRVTEDSTVRCEAGLNCQRILGQNTDEETKRNSTQSRIFWREIPGLKTTTESH